MTIGSPPVLVDVIELFRSTFTPEYPDVEAEGPRDNVTFSISANVQDSNNAFRKGKVRLTRWGIRVRIHQLAGGISFVR